MACCAGDNVKSGHSTMLTPETAPVDYCLTQSIHWRDYFLKFPWEINTATTDKEVFKLETGAESLGTGCR